MTPYVAGARRTWVNARFAQTGRYTRQHEDHNYPMDEFPFTFATTTDPLTGKTDGMLAACTASSTCPNLIQVDADSEYYGAHASLILTDTSGQALELPPNVRYWMLATAHLQGERRVPRPGQPGAAVAVLPDRRSTRWCSGCGTASSRRRRARRRWPTARR